MPQVAAAWIASAIIGATSATGAAATAITIASQVVVAAAVNAAASAILAPKTQSAEGRATEWTPDPDAPMPFIFGQRGAAGTIVHREAWGQNNRYQSIISVYSGAGPISSYGATYVDGSAVTFTGELMDGLPVNRLYRQTRLGAQPETAHTTSSITGSYAMAAWSPSHKLSGKASSCVTLRQDGDFKYWPTGEPKYIQVVNGLLCYDPRLDSTYPGGSGSCRLATRSTWVYSTNGAIQALNWALGLFENGAQVGGIGADFDQIDVDAFIGAANIADTNSWTSGAVCWADAPAGDDKYEVLIGLLQTCGARPASKAGMISCVSFAANGSSVATITGADVIGPFTYRGMTAREGRINTIIPRCVSADHDWENVDLEPVSNSTYVTEDGGATRLRGVTYGYVTSANQAAQLARYDIANSREGISGTITVRTYLRDIEPGDCFTINEVEFGMSSLKCLCLSRDYDPETDGVRLTFRSETAAKHAWALAGAGTAPATPTLGGDDPTTVPTPSGSDWAIAAGTGETPSVVITGAVPSTLTVSKIVVEHKADAASAWVPLGEYNPESTSFEATGLLANTSWEARLAYRNLFGALGSYLSLGPVTTAGNTATAVDPTIELVSGTGDTALRIRDGQLWTGAGGIENAGAVLDSNGLIQRMSDPTISVGGLVYMDANGLTAAAMQQIAAENRTTPPATRVVQAQVPHAATSGAVASYLTTTLLAASDVQLDVSFSLAAFSESLSDFPATITVTLYEQYSTDGGGSWSTLTAVTGGSVTLTRVTTGTPTASEYLVEAGSFNKFDGVDISPTTYYRVTDPAALTIAVSAVNKAEAMWRWALVGPTGSAWRVASSTITATDTDDKPSFLVGNVSASASTPWANPVGHSHELVIQNTSTTDIGVTASAVTISTASGGVRTVRDVNMTLDTTASGAGGLDTGSMAINTHYAVYMISNGTDAGDALLCSTSFTAPTLPSGYSYAGRIGAFVTDSGATTIRPFLKKGNRTRYVQTSGSYLYTLKSGSHGSVSTPTWVATSYSAIVPSTAIDVALAVYLTGNTLMMAPSNTYGEEGDSSNPPYICIKSGGTTEAHAVEIPNENGNLYSASNNAGSRIRVSGYTDSV